MAENTLNSIRLQPSPQPLVSVALLTYNHASFLTKALDSVLAQQCDFRFEIVLSDDFSSDGTEEICKSYAAKHPDIIRLLQHSEALGLQRNISTTLNACAGEFIAYLDGDDYWTDPFKLQMQYEALRDHPDCPLVFHDTELLYENCMPGLLRPPGVYQRYGLSDILQKNFIAAQSAMFRRECVAWLPTWLQEDPLVPWDWPFFIECAKRGNLYYLEGQMATYRVHSQGFWTGQSTRRRLAALSKMLRLQSKGLSWYLKPVAAKTRAMLAVKYTLAIFAPFVLKAILRMRHVHLGH